MSDTFNNDRGPWYREPPKPEPEVQATMERNQATRQGRNFGAKVGPVQGFITFLLFLFFCGLAIGAIAAGIYLPVKFIAWIFS